MDILATGLARVTAPHLAKMVEKLGKGQFDRFIATCTNVFGDHLATAIRRCSSTKNILYKDPIPLETQYVATKLHNQLGTDLADKDILTLATTQTFSGLVTGLAGSGKSMFMKWLTLRLAETITSHQRIPLFIEAREIGDDQENSSIDEILFRQTSSEQSHSTFDQFKIGLNYGSFVVLIDGLDEIDPKDRDSFLRRVSYFRNSYPSCSLIASSRAERQIESLSNLNVLQILPMDLGRVNELIGKLQYDPKKKAAFLKEVNERLFDEHETFLSNPLLCVIMLITYDFASHIPSTLATFYSQVYEALFFRHDSSKAYTRRHFAGLGLDQFESVLKFFSFETYAKKAVTFSETELTQLIRKSLSRADFGDVSPAAVIMDCKQSLCLLQDDGLDVSYVHRSFQEYFTARYLQYQKSSSFELALDKISRRSPTDNVIRMLYELDPVEIKRRWIWPTLVAAACKLEKVAQDDPQSIVDAIKSMFNRIIMNLHTSEVESPYWTSSSDTGPLYMALSVLDPQAMLVPRSLLCGPFLPEEVGSIAHLMRHPDLGDAAIRRQVQDGLYKSREGKLELFVEALSAQWVHLTNLGELICALRTNLLETARILENDLKSTDDFTSDMLSLM